MAILYLRRRRMFGRGICSEGMQCRGDCTATLLHGLRTRMQCGDDYTTRATIVHYSTMAHYSIILAHYNTRALEYSRTRLLALH